MSRSRRKTPIFGITNCKSERQDKVIWHGRLRANTHTALTSLSPPEHDGKVMPAVREISNPWSMGKDGRHWWPLQRQAALAERRAQRKGQSRTERDAIKARLQHKWMGK